ncbi:hypothetical protein K466DRAFT_281365 [Polyporus arcularius HHB13444]|uniref:Transmembrane protein n=1 Tax=Polyporus arcularius HHB13444 TaxID=1314778 RepID=A0A5C3P3R2_9APHY|nr:hypothetical protein K466DRAFT_281365 [Polyporus arcularius HHB13444]
MVQWQSPTEIAKDGVVFDKFMHTLLGLYIWEFITSLSFDWQYISGKKKFKWPLIFYFSGRYCLLFALIGIAIALNVTEPVNCQALYTYNQLFGNATIGFASINLSLRTMAVWSMSLWVVVPLIAISLGHWSLLLHGILLTSSWVDGQGCVITTTSNTILAATFIYTMCFDFLVLTLTAIKLGITGTPRRDRSRIVILIFDDGLIFFLVAFGANVIATSFMVVNLNAVMSIIANVPAAVASTIVSCRVVRRLTNYTTEGAEVFGSTHASTLAFTRSRLTTRGIFSEKKPGVVNVQMDTFEAAPGEHSPSDTVSVSTYDVSGQKTKRCQVESFVQDIEASPIEEYKAPPFQ